MSRADERWCIVAKEGHTAMAERTRVISVAVLLIALGLGIGGTLGSCSFMADLKKKTNEDTPQVIYPPVNENKPAKPDAK